MKLRLSQQRNQALTLVEVLIVIAVVIGFAVLFLPGSGESKGEVQRINCICNLKLIGTAFRLWESNHGDKYPMSVSVTNGGVMELMATGNVAVCFQSMSNELGTPRILYCPADIHRIYATNFVTGFGSANISYIVNADAIETYPQMIMFGDDNLLVDSKPVHPGTLNFWTNQSIAWTKDRHHGVGNIGMADGSVQQITSAGLNSAMVSSPSVIPTNVTVNRWLIP